MALFDTIAQYHGRLNVCVGISTSIIYLLILFRALAAPGFTFCDDVSCPARGPLDLAADIPVVFIAIILYSVLLVFSAVLLACPAKMLRNPHIDKWWPGVWIFLIVLSCIILIVPAVQRDYVVPYFHYVPYRIQLQPTTKDPAYALVSVEGFPSSLVLGDRFRLRVAEAVGDERNLRDLSPTAREIYTDRAADTSRVAALNWTRAEVVVGPLRANRWYMAILEPARIARTTTGGREVVPDSYRRAVDPLRIPSRPSEASGRVDIRAYKLCLWTGEAGCDARRGIH
eukprot:TRINITY_DN8884_c0_g1_i2.p1 TRINITY_DN8884_c0_g1~~TRINITY_DN8884_c0_g1_i2.p1  ORF type:complete len:285 (+),score=22.34 TRINITY_DN8884_c0_g1_i2:15-869(+)